MESAFSTRDWKVMEPTDVIQYHHSHSVQEWRKYEKFRGENASFEEFLQEVLKTAVNGIENALEENAWLRTHKQEIRVESHCDIIRKFIHTTISLRHADTPREWEILTELEKRKWNNESNDNN
jgi:hypothetical protein